MKFKTKIQKVVGTSTRDGVTIPVTRTQTTAIPVLPRDWQTTILRTTIGIAVALTVIVIIWSTVSIGALLGGDLGYMVAVIFDVAWIMALLLSYLSRYDESKRALPERGGWVLLLASMGAIFWHGWTLHSIPMAVVGASASLLAKVMWIGVMKHINAELSEDDKAWLAHEISQAQASAARAQVRRQTARIEHRTALELLAMERETNDARAAYGLEPTTVEQLNTGARETHTLALAAPTLVDLSKSDAVRFVQRQYPELEASQIVEVLECEGVEIRKDYVTQVLSRVSEPEPETADADVIALRK